MMLARENRPPISATAKANAQMAAAVVVAVGAWHLAVWVCSTGLPVTAVGRTVWALVRFAPFDLGPGVSTAPAGVVVTVWVTLVAAAGGGVIWAVARRRRRRAAKGMTTGAALTRRAGTGPATVMTAPFARYQGQPVRARAEDTGIVIAPPRQGKTAYLAVGQVVDAPGAVVATSTKVDLLRLTVQQRTAAGRVHVFDPEGISGWPTRTRWNIVDGCADVRVAMARSRAMVAARPTEGTRNAGFFTEAADTVLRCLLHAADLGGHTMREVLAWARDFDDDTPYDILRDHPDAAPGWAAELGKFCRGEARETVSSTDMSLALVLKPLADPRVVDMVCPPPPGQEEGECFDPTRFVASTDTLYLLCEGGASSTAPLSTALVASVVHSARRVSQRTASGRITPAMTFILDEVANIAPIPDLPSLMSDGGGRGLSVWAVAQSPSQLRERYGTNGAESIFSAAAAKVLLGGCADDRFLDSVSRLLGERRVSRSGRHYDKRGSTPTYNMTTERERVMPIDRLRTIGEGHALLMYRDIAGAVVELTPWWKRPDAHAFEASMAWALTQEGITPTPAAPTARRRGRSAARRRPLTRGAA